MFEHLSDPRPPSFGTEFRRHVLDRARVRRRHARLAAGSVALLPTVLAGAGLVFLRRQAGELERIEMSALVPATTAAPVVVGEPAPAATAEATEATEAPPIASPLNVLLVGVDRQPPDSGVEGTRSDTIVLVRVDPDLQRVGMLSLPRDLLVTAPDGRDRLAAFTGDDLVQVVSSTLAVDINHYVEIDFDGFRSLVDLIGGITLPFEHAVRDRNTGFTATPGCNRLSGDGALAYVRSRFLEELDPETGLWIADPTSDIGRIARQQDVIRRVFVEVLAHDYGTVDRSRLVTDVLDDITVDIGLDASGLLAIFNAAALIGPDHFDTYDLAGAVTAEIVDQSSVLLADPTAVQAQIDRLLHPSADPPTTPPASTPIDWIAPADTTC